MQMNPQLMQSMCQEMMRMFAAQGSSIANFAGIQDHQHDTVLAAGRMLGGLYKLHSIISSSRNKEAAFPCDHYSNKQLSDLKHWYVNYFDDYLISNPPHFLVALLRLHVLVLWPISFANLFGSATGKSWFPTTSLIFGVSAFTSMMAIIGEATGSGKGSEKMLTFCYITVGMAVLVTVRGLVGCGQSHCSPAGAAVKHAVERKKRA